MKIPKTPKGLYSRIDEYKKVLKKEKREWGAYDDSYGRRFLIGPLYLLANDTEGALKYYKWYRKNFPDDIPEPHMSQCWILSLYRAGKIEEAKLKLYQTMLSNLYLLPHLFKMDIPYDYTRLGSNWDTKEYALSIQEEYLSVWTDDDKDWARFIYNSDEVSNYRSKYIDLGRLLGVLNPGFERNEVVSELRSIKELNPFNE